MERRAFLKTCSLIAAGGLVPGFLARAAEHAKPGKDRLLVVLEWTGGNDGLNTVIPCADDLYYRARPTLAIPKKQVLPIDDHLGLHPKLKGLQALLDKDELAVAVGVGYPNPTRSHFDSMDVWQSADPGRRTRTGWLARSLAGLKAPPEGFLALHLAPTRLPLALDGASGGVASLNDPASFTLQLSGDPARAKRRRQLLETLNTSPAGATDLTAFIRRQQVRTFKTAETIQEALARPDKEAALPGLPSPLIPPGVFPSQPLAQQLSAISRLIRKGIGARIYYTSIDGFDTHTAQAATHGPLLEQVGDAINSFFSQLRQSGDADRVVLLTYSEFGRRVAENGSQGTDHGAASSLFVAGPAVKAGVVGTHPRLDDLVAGDLKYGIDFRRVYATLLDRWLDCDSQAVLGGKFEALPLLTRG
jgi:uncharacterized protein (DUF1501 family)